MSNPNAPQPVASGMPAGNLIASIFDGVDTAVTTVADIVNNHADRLASNPCAWRNDVLLVQLPQVRNRTARAWGLALSITQAGAQAVLSARASAGYPTTNRKFNSSTVQRFGTYLLGQGIPVAPPGAPAYILDQHPFVKRGPPDSSFTVPVAGFPGVGFRNNKLAGPTIVQYWNAWNAAMTVTVEPRGTVRQYRGATGWRAILALLTGRGAPAWAPGDTVLPGSYIAQAEEAQAVLEAFLAEATVACQNMQTSGGGGDDDGGGAGGLAISTILLLLLGGV